MRKKKRCSLCPKKAVTRGFCATCYQRLYHKNKISIARHAGYDPLKARLSKIMGNINGRCYNPRASKYENYGMRGIKNHLTLEDLRYLWKRDKADKMAQPSINRKDSLKDYSRSNCQFIEFALNRIQRHYEYKKGECRHCQAVTAHCSVKCCQDCKKKRKCGTCGELFPREVKGSRCLKCDPGITRPCAYCGVIITRRGYNARNKQFFCSKKEHGAWLGKTHRAGGRKRLASSAVVC